ncbi:UNVERIFIED_CONTAM: hypothetical protein K2H54_026633 [Gekko kuhli]
MSTLELGTAKHLTEEGIGIPGSALGSRNGTGPVPDQVKEARAELTVVIPEQVPLDRIRLPRAKNSGVEETRRRRSVFLQPEEEEAAALLIRLPSGLGPDPGSDLYLNLHQNTQFLAPGFSIEEIGEDLKSHREGVDHSCFYTGHVLNRTLDSFASLSACAGLVLACTTPGVLGRGDGMLGNRGLFSVKIANGGLDGAWV